MRQAVQAHEGSSVRCRQCQTAESRREVLLSEDKVVDDHGTEEEEERRRVIFGARRWPAGSSAALSAFLSRLLCGTLTQL